MLGPEQWNANHWLLWDMALPSGHVHEDAHRLNPMGISFLVQSRRSGVSRRGGCGHRIARNSMVTTTLTRYSIGAASSGTIVWSMPTTVGA